MNAKEFLVKLLDDGTGERVVSACRQYVQKNGSFAGLDIKQRMICCGGNWVAMTFSALPNEIAEIFPENLTDYGGDESGIAAILAAKAAYNLLGGRVVLQVRNSSGRIISNRLGLPWEGVTFE